jgi:arginyl-tRNA synthetase
LLRAALRAIGAPEETEIVLEAPRQPEHGDLATSVALGLARTLGKSPREIAEAIVGALEVDPRLVAGVEVAGAGFINFRMTPEFFRAQLEKASAAGGGYGRCSIGDGEKTNIEYVSANPTGPLHTGHGRNAAIGDTIANIMQWCGYDVTREYYFNNAGNQMRLLARSIHARYRQVLGLEAEIPEGGYAGDYITTIASEIVTTYGDTFAEPTEKSFEAMRDIGERWSFGRIKETLRRLGIEHDFFFNEDTLYKNGQVDQIVSELERLGRTYRKDGALWLKLDDYDLPDRVIVRSSGEPTYRLPDIAYHREKFRRGFQLMVDVFGADHIGTIADVKAAIDMLGYDSSKIKVVLNQMVSFVEGGQPVKMSKRTGTALTLDELLDELGSDVVRFFFIMRGVNTQLEFDLDLAREHSEKNPVFYLQYAHARIAGVLRHVESEGITLDKSASLDPLDQPEELQLIKQILEFPDTIQRAAREFEPQVVAEYLRDLASAFHKFYHECRIIAEEPQLRNARMRLLAITKTTLGNGLKVLGITAPERM